MAVCLAGAQHLVVDRVSGQFAGFPQRRQGAVCPPVGGERTAVEVAQVGHEGDRFQAVPTNQHVVVPVAVKIGEDDAGVDVDRFLFEIRLTRQGAEEVVTGAVEFGAGPEQRPGGGEHLHAVIRVDGDNLPGAIAVQIAHGEIEQVEAGGQRVFLAGNDTLLRVVGHAVDTDCPLFPGQGRLTEEHGRVPRHIHGAQVVADPGQELAQLAAVPLVHARIGHLTGAGADIDLLAAVAVQVRQGDTVVAQVIGQGNGGDLLELAVQEAIEKQFRPGQQDDLDRAVAVQIAGVQVHQFHGHLAAAVAGDQIEAGALFQPGEAAGNEILAVGALGVRGLEGGRALGLCRGGGGFLRANLAEDGAADLPGQVVDGTHGILHGGQGMGELARCLTGVFREDIAGEGEILALGRERAHDQVVRAGLPQLLAEGFIVAGFERASHLLGRRTLGHGDDVRPTGQTAGQHAGQPVAQIRVGSGQVHREGQEEHLAPGWCCLCRRIGGQGVSGTGKDHRDDAGSGQQAGHEHEDCSGEAGGQGNGGQCGDGIHNGHSCVCTPIGEGRPGRGRSGRPGNCCWWEARLGMSQ